MFLVNFFAALPIWLYNCWHLYDTQPDFSAETSKRSEARALFSEYPKAEMGVGSRASSMDIRYRVVSGFLGNVSKFDVVNWMDLRCAGEPVHIVRPLVENCRVPAWILPKGEQVFTAEGFGVPLFDDVFRETFFARYRLVQTASHFEVWQCSQAQEAG